MKVNKVIEAEFFYGASPLIFQRARELRNNMTPFEKMLWKKINERKINGWHFRRQHPINQFIADFYCHSVRLVIEVDGEVHNEISQKERDEGRNYFMNELGLTVMRFTNSQIESDMENVLKEIKAHVYPNPSPNGEG